MLGEITIMRALLFGASLALAAAAPASAAVNLVTNGSFETVSVTDKSTFQGNVAGWSGGQNLTFIDFPGTADDPSKYLAVYGPFPTTSPDGGNFVEGDGDPSYSGAIFQTISGLTVGKQYVLNFYQAAGQQLGFTGPTTEQWQVTFGDETQLSSLFSLPEAGVGPWQAQRMTFTATAATQVLSFLAKGTPGGAPPISFLDGVSLMAAVPEPTSWALMIVGFGAVGATMRRRRTVAATA
jgi:hypothetical protein